MSTKKTIIFLFIILAIAVFFRFWQLDQTPPGLYPDIAMNGTNAISAMESGDYKVFYQDNNGREGLFINLIALNFKYFGVSVLNIRLVSAILGWLTILGMFFLTRELFVRLKHADKANLIALLATFFISISFWHVNFSRMGFRAIMLPFCLVWSFYFLFKALSATQISEPRQNDPDKNSIYPPKPIGHKLRAISYWLIAGLFFGLAFHTYISARVAPIILLPLLIFSVIAYWPRLKIFIRERKSLGSPFKNIYLKDGWFGWDVFLIVFIIAILPLVLYFLGNPADFMGRTGQVSVLAGSNPLSELITGTIKTLGQFVAVGDFNWRHNIAGSPEIFWPLIPFFLLGLFYSSWQIFKKKSYRPNNYFDATVYWTLILWWGAMLLPSILTNEGLPHALRSIGAIPPAFIFAGLGAYLFIKFLHRLIKNPKAVIAANVIIILLLAAMAGAEYWRYFIFWGQNEITRGAFTQLYVDEAAYLNSLPSNVAKFVIVNAPGVPVPYPSGPPVSAQTIKFLTYQKSNIKYLIADQKSNFQFPSGPKIILPMNYDSLIFSSLKAEFPAGQIENINNEFSVFKIN